MSRLLEVEAYVAVAEQGSFVAAASALGLSSSYVSKLVTRLEQRLGARLIQRTTRRHSLTPQGERYLADCQAAFALLRRSEACIHEDAAALRGEVRLTAPTGIGLGMLANLFHQFAAANPEVRLSIHYLDRLVDLVGERYDLAVRVGALPDSSLRARRVGSHQTAVFASPAVARSLDNATHPRDLRGAAAVVYSGRARPGVWTLRSGTETTTVEVERRLASNNGRALALATASGLGISLLPTFHTCDLVREGRLVRVLEDWGGEVPVHVVFPTQNQLPLRVRALIDFVAAQLAAPPS